MTKKFLTRLMQTSLMCCLAVLFTACDDFFGNESNPTSAYLGMSDKPVTIKVGETFQRQAIAAGTAVIEYTSSDTKVATVDNTGLVTAIAEGETTITATATGYSSQTGKKIYLPDSKSYKLTVKPATLPAATITTAPVATTGDIIAGSATALVTAGVADGGTMMYQVTATNTKPTTTDGFSATVPTAATLAGGTYYVWYYAKADAQHSDSEIAATAVEVTVQPNLKNTPLTMEAITAGTIVVNSPKSGMQYSLNGGAKKAVTTDAITVAVGDKVAFYGSGTTITSYNGTHITGGTAEVKVYGNIMSLVYETGFATNTTLTAEYTFKNLFDNNANLKDASGLLLPAETLTNYCYSQMFIGCTSLTAAPALPATTLANDCYKYMFYGCTSLTTAPAELPAEELAENCYYSMFSGCTKLTTAPALPAKVLAKSCYERMFYGCTSLATAPAKLPATTLKEYCYYYMFRDCSSLTTAPALPATTLANYCYYYMFSGCTSLTTAPKLPATSLAKRCYYAMFYYCAALTNAYVKAAYTAANDECYNMFKGCTAVGATLHTTNDNKASWDGVMESNWTVANDWTD